MKHYVYELRINNIPVYVGETKNPKQRMYFHKGNRKSKFYGDQIEMFIVEEYNTEKEAYDYQCHLQTQYEFVTDRQRMARPGEKNPKTKLTNEQVLEIRGSYIKGNGAELGRKYGVCRMVIGKIINGKSFMNL